MQIIEKWQAKAYKGNIREQPKMTQQNRQIQIGPTTSSAPKLFNSLMPNTHVGSSSKQLPVKSSSGPAPHVKQNIPEKKQGKNTKKQNENLSIKKSNKKNLSNKNNNNLSNKNSKEMFSMKMWECTTGPLAGQVRGRLISLSYPINTHTTFSSLISGS